MILSVRCAVVMAWAIVPAVACVATAQAQAPAPVPFTLERALESARRVDPMATLPVVELPEGAVAHENLTFADRGADGELALDLYIPGGEGPHPVVLLVHGGGWESGDRTMERALARRLVAEGFAAAPVSYRLGSAGRFPAALHDLKAAVRWLRAHAATYSLDAHAIGAVGGSAGGHLVALLGATNDIERFEGDGPHRDQRSTVRAVVDLDGLADFTGAALLAQQRERPGAPVRFLGCAYDEDPARWREASPITHVGLRSSPTLFINSGAATPILPGREQMSVRLRMVGADSAVVTLEGAPHVFWLVQPWFELAADEATAFLRKHLVGDGVRVRD